MDELVAERAFEEAVPACWSPEAALTLARAAWIARCARSMHAFAWDVELEQARAVAEVLADDRGLRALSPEAVGERMVQSRR